MEISFDDLRQLYQHSIVMYKNKPVYIQDVSRDGELMYFDLVSQRGGVAKFSMKDFIPPASRRIGFINTKGSVVYAYRIPIRRYKVGISTENLKVKTLEVHYPQKGVVERIRELHAPEIADAMLDKYPSLEQCMEHVAKFNGAMAFDKQFAVTSHGYIFYKTNYVGNIKRGCKKTSDIVFHDGQKHLSILLDGNYEKTVRIA